MPATCDGGVHEHGGHYPRTTKADGRGGAYDSVFVPNEMGRFVTNTPAEHDSKYECDIYFDDHWYPRGSGATVPFMDDEHIRSESLCC